jgi:hypothetical protein
MSIPTISPLPIAPQTSDAPSVFSTRANTFVAALSTLVTETNAATAEVNSALAGALVLYDGYQGDWSAGTYDLGDVVRKDGLFYISLTAANTQEPPDTNWQELLSALSSPFDASNVALTATNVQAALEELCTLPTSAKAASYTLTAADTGGLVSISAGNITVPPNVFSAGDTVVIFNNATDPRSILRGSGVTMYWINGVNANRQLIQRGLATIVCVGSNQFVITGQGVQ